MWRTTRMVVLCAISAALYRRRVVPFKVCRDSGVTDCVPQRDSSGLLVPIWSAGPGFRDRKYRRFFGGGFAGRHRRSSRTRLRMDPVQSVGMNRARREPVLSSPIVIIKYVITCLAASVLCATTGRMG